MLSRVAVRLLIIKLMQQIGQLYDKTKKSLLLANKNDPDGGVEILKEVLQRVKELRKKHPELKKQYDSLQVIALNNMACAHDKKHRLRASLHCLQMAMSIQEQMFPDLASTSNPETLHQVATTHSNICAVLSQMGDHGRALSQIKTAIDLLLRTQLTKNSHALVVFYYNCAVEHEYMNSLNEARKMAERGLALASTCNKEMEGKLAELAERLEDKIRTREKKMAKALVNTIRMRSGSRQQMDELHKRGNSLTIIPTTHRNEQQKSYEAPFTKIYRSRSRKTSEYPKVSLPSFPRSQVAPSGARLEFRNKFMTVYEPRQQRRLYLSNKDASKAKIKIQLD